MRKLAREICFEMIFEILTRNECEINEQTLELLCEQENVLGDDDKQFVVKVVDSFIKNKDQILNSIYEKVTGFAPERIYRVDLALIGLGLTEIKYVGEVDKGVVINEVVELAKKFSSEKSPKFVNGVLSALVEA